jgi:site-specific DNA recombinase
VRQVNMTISLAFLAPDLVRAAVEGRLPRGIGVERLRDASAEWSGQFEALGLRPQELDQGYSPAHRTGMELVRGPAAE